VSFDEDECLAFLEVPVTSIAMPLAELGAAAVDALIARIEGSPAQDVLIGGPMRLVPRDSVARASSGGSVARASSGGSVARVPGGSVARARGGRLGARGPAAVDPVGLAGGRSAGGAGRV
jgi:Periplasmic binding protein-like domain